MSPAEVHDVGVVISLNVALQHVDKQLLLLTQYHNPLEKTVCLKQKNFDFLMSQKLSLNISQALGLLEKFLSNRKPFKIQLSETVTY